MIAVTCQCEGFTILRVTQGESHGLASTYLRRKHLGGGFARFESLQALAYVVAQRRNRYSSKVWGIALEPPQRPLQQEHGSQWVVALQVMERGSYLDQTLQKCLLRFGQTPATRFPRPRGQQKTHPRGTNAGLPPGRLRSNRVS